MTKLDRCWKNCLRMRKWVSSKYDGTVSVLSLKREWLKRHRFKKGIVADCFFCQWAYDHGERNFLYMKTGCPQCPGRLVDPRFKCGNIRYDFDAKAKAFYRKIVHLNNIRTGVTP